MTVKPSSQSGFSLIEVALVMIIGGILLSMFSGTLLTMISSAKMKTTQERMKSINEAIQIYATSNNKLPCVAQRTIAVNAPAASNYGKEINCAGGTPAGTVEVGTGVNRVRIGFVPTRTLNLPDEIGYDAWGSRIMYAVTRTMTDTTTYDPATAGRIQIEDSFGTSLTTTATYIVYSIGRDGRGGFNTEGNLIGACNVPTPRVDIENCDDADRLFISTMMTGNTDNATHYDDYLTYEGNFQSSIIPSGAILAFDRPACPSGWAEATELRGRTIIGVGTFTEAAAPPNATNGIDGTATFNAGVAGGWASRMSGQASPDRIDNLPPYISYLYCRKT